MPALRSRRSTYGIVLPVLGMLGFAVSVVVLPFLLAPALGTGAFSDLSEWINAPQW